MCITILCSFLLIMFQDAVPRQQEPAFLVPIISAAISAMALIAVGGLTYFLNKRNFEKTQQHNEATLEAAKKHNEAALTETKRQNKALMDESRLLKKRESIEKVLNEFYMPLHAYLQVTYSLGHIIKKGKPAKFRLLTHLLEPDQLYRTENNEEIKIVLSNSDKKIIKEMLKIEEEIETIIATKTGLVDDPEFMTDYLPISGQQDSKPKIKIGLIPHLVTHFRIFRMANDGSIRGESTRYKEFVFPKQLTPQLLEKINSLQKELKDLSLQ